MPVSERTDQFLHSKLPIDKEEKILAVYKHHWFAYASSWILGIFIVIVVMALAAGLTMVGGSDSNFEQYRTQILAGAAVFSAFVLIGTFIPVYLRSQEQVVLTEEALLQVLQPSLFASKIDQLNLQHITDVSVHQDFFGTLLGYGHINIETPGEQNNYRFAMMPKPHQVAREIAQAHENYDAAIQAGRIPSSLSMAQPAAPAIDPQQYQQFLQYQQMVAQQQAQPAPQDQPNQPAPAEEPNNTPPQNQ